MKDPRKLGLESISSIPVGLIEGVQRDLIRDPNLRQKVIHAITTANFGFEIAILTGAQAVKQQDLPPDEAYALGAYLMIGALLAQQETAALSQLVSFETIPAPEDAFLATADDDSHVGDEVQPPAV